MEPVLVTFIVFGSCGLILWKYLENRHKERIAMIDKGTNASDLRGEPFRFRVSPLTNLKWGLLALFIGTGIMVANRLYEVWNWDDSIYPSMIFIFGGVSLIVFYVIAARKEKQG